MTILQAIISGMVQGLTEFLPMSSSGHLVILHRLLGYGEPKLIFDIFLHVGTLLAVIIFFTEDIVKLFTSKHRRGAFVILAFLGSMPTAVIGYKFSAGFERMFGELHIVGWMLIVTALCLFLGSASTRLNWGEQGRLNWWRAILIGITQGLAIAPGISRSGITISAGLISGMRRQTAFRFSFLLSIPAIIGALVFKLIHGNSTNGVGAVCVLIGMITACAVGLFSLRMLRNVIIKGKLYFFGIYCAILGTVVLMLR